MVPITVQDKGLLFWHTPATCTTLSLDHGLDYSMDENYCSFLTKLRRRTMFMLLYTLNYIPNILFNIIIYVILLRQKVLKERDCLETDSCLVEFL